MLFITWFWRCGLSLEDKAKMPRRTRFGILMEGSSVQEHCSEEKAIQPGNGRIILDVSN
jgi:hypothetical protein